MIINMFQVSRYVATLKAKSYMDRIEYHWDEIVEDFQRIEDSFFQWNLQASHRYGFAQVETPRNTGDSKPFTYHAYLGFWTLCLWNKQRAARILLHQSLLGALDALVSTSEDDLSKIYQCQRESSISTMQTMAEFILASVPFSLGDVPLPPEIRGPKSVGGYFLVWPLQVILQTPNLPESQRCLAKDALLRIGRQCGISYATIFAHKYSIPAALLLDKSRHSSFRNIHSVWSKWYCIVLPQDKLYRALLRMQCKIFKR